MKKITSYFMAFLPIFLIILLFALGLIVKDYSHVYVQSVEMINTSIAHQWKYDEATSSIDFSTNTIVHPSNASNPALAYYTDNDQILSIDSDSGKAKATGYGDVNIYAVSKENESLKATCKVNVWDNEVHDVKVDNLAKANFMNFYDVVQLNVQPIPSEHVKCSYKFTSSDENIVSVTETTGILQSKGTAGTATISIVATDATTGKETQPHNIDVTVGQTLEAITFKNAGNETIVDTTYDLYDNMLTYPIKKETIVGTKQPKDCFKFTSSDESAATVDANGLVTFKKANEPVTFTVSYINDDSIVGTKTISSTLQNCIDVSFNRYYLDKTLDSVKDNNELTELKLDVYPAEATSRLDVTIEGDKVVKYENGKFIATGQTGTAIIKAKANTSSTTTKTDQCVVTITDGKAEFLNTQSKQIDDYYLNLKQLVNYSVLPLNNNEIEWSISEGSDVGFVNNNILYFNKAGKIKLTAAPKSSAFSAKEVSIECKGSDDVTINIDEEVAPKTTVGKSVVFKDGDDNTWTPTDAEHFYTSGDKTFTKCGSQGKLKSLQLTNGSDTRTINLTITEPAFNLEYSSNWPCYTTAKTEINLSDELKTFPSTATDDQDEAITPTFTLDAEEGATLKNNVVTFSKASSAVVKATLNSTTSNFELKSTFGTGGKFALNDASSNKLIQSGDTITMSKLATKQLTLDVNSLYVKDISVEQLLSEFKVSSQSNGKIVSIDNPKLSEDKTKLTFTISPNTSSKVRGDDVITIQCGNFTFYLNIHISEDITDFKLYCNNKELSQTSANLAYDNNLILYLSVEPYNLENIQDKISVTWNGKDVTMTNFMISLKDQTWNDSNTLTIESTSSNFSKSYTINDASTQTPNYYIAGAEKDKTVNIPSGSTYVICSINLEGNGFAGEEYFKNFKIDFSEGSSLQAENVSNLMVITGLSTQQSGKVEEAIPFTLKYNNTNSKEYSLLRDTVSKVILPDHDNSQSADLKGLQKVHVYGDKSYYDPTEGTVDFYRLPVELYDCDWNLITDEQFKINALKTLNFTIDNGNATIEEANACIDIRFNSLYTFDEIYNNEFTSKAKNANFSIATAWAAENKNDSASLLKSAKYSFVPVEGTNVYCQEGLAENKGLEKAVVFQTNFGLETITEHNVPFTNAELASIGTIYGNGYGINFEARTQLGIEKQQPLTGFSFWKAINVRFIGCNASTLASMTKKFFSLYNPGKPGDTLVKYCEFTSFFQALTIYGVAKATKAHVNNCIFIGNKATGMSISDEGTEAYLEDVVFFHSSYVGIVLQKSAKLYLKGNVEFYNFGGSEIFKEVAEFIWDIAEPMLEDKGMIQTRTDTIKCANACVLHLLAGGIYFWDKASGQYQYQPEKHPDSCPYLHDGITLEVRILGISVGIWSSYTPSIDPTAPNINQEYIEDPITHAMILNNETLTRLRNRISRI